MRLILTEAQRDEIESAGERPVRITIPGSDREYVLAPAEQYDRLQSLARELTMAQVGDLVERTMREYDEEDPTLASYEKYRP